MTGDLENIILGTIERWWAGRYSEKHGLVTAYDPKLHLAKVMFQPQGQESGWIPIETGHIGAGYGIAVGLQPGDGKATGDQVVVRYQEGDIEAGKVVQRVHSDNDTPPPVESGEMVIWTKFQKSGGGPNSAQGGQGGTGQQIYLKKDGTITVTDGNGATIVFDGKGGIAIKSKTFTLDVDGVMTLVSGGDAGFQGGGNVVVNGGSTTGINAGGRVVIKAGGSVSSGSVNPASEAPPMPPFEVTS